MTADLALRGEVELLHQQVAASKQEFCIDLEGIAPDGMPVWQWMGYSTKGSATRSLAKLIEGMDFLTMRLESSGGRPAERILFSRDGFKQWGMLAGTERGRQIRLYFIECEKRLQLGMAQPTAMNASIDRLAATVERGLAGLYQSNVEIKEKISDLDERVSRLEEQQCDQLYVFVRSSDLTIKLGYTQELEKRRKAHESRGFELVGSVPGTRKRETEIKRSLRSKGFRPKNGEEEYALSAEIVAAFAQEGLPIGNLCSSRPKFALPRRFSPACETLSLPLF